MFSKQLGKLADKLMENETNPNIDRDIIIYGLSSAIEQGISLLTAIIIALGFGLLIETVVFIVSFSLIRMYAGGYHCKKAINCYLVSSGIIICVLATVKYIPEQYMFMTSIVTLVVSDALILKLAPIETPTKPLDEIELQYYRKKLIKNLIIENLVIFILFIMHLNTFVFIISLGIFVSSMMLVMEVLASKIRG